MSNLEIRLLIVAVLAVVCGVVADTAQGQCDNDCRMKSMHKYDTGECIQISGANCIFCQPGWNVRCEQKGPYGGKCIQSDTTQVIWYYDSCTLVCNGAHAVLEAKDMVGKQTKVASTPHYYCD